MIFKIVTTFSLCAIYVQLHDKSSPTFFLEKNSSKSMMMASDQSFGGGRNLSSNHFTGPIPKEIGMIFNLDRMWVQLNLYPSKLLIGDENFIFYFVSLGIILCNLDIMNILKKESHYVQNSSTETFLCISVIEGFARTLFWYHHHSCFVPI